VASKSGIDKESKFYLTCMQEILNQNQKFLKFNQILMNRSLKNQKLADENRYLYVSENALLELLDHCEPIQDEDVDTLIKMTKNTRFNILRVKLLEKKDDLVQCL
jgi:hypothetical protein